MRMIAALVITAAAGVSGAEASSFVTPDVVQEAAGPSFIVFGAADGVGDAEMRAPPSGSSVSPPSLEAASPSIIALGKPADVPVPSIVALGEPAAGIAYDKVSAIPKATDRRPTMMPMVIRGGMVGEAFVQPAPATSGPDEAAATTALDPNDRSTPSKRKALKRQAEQQQALESAPQAAPEPMPETE